ncbi:hypothetical protein D3C78_1359590 [compost metagenome]
MDSSRGSSSRPAAWLAASARAAKPEADEARPAAVGKLFWESTLALSEMPALLRTRSRNLLILANSESASALPLSETASEA